MRLCYGTLNSDVGMERWALRRGGGDESWMVMYKYYHVGKCLDIMICLGSIASSATAGPFSMSITASSHHLTALSVPSIAPSDDFLQVIHTEVHEQRARCHSGTPRLQNTLSGCC
jgi:hypothetical protein